MTDPLRSDRTSASGDASDRERDARIEALLLQGLDHYFAGEHELAINVWTRVLFLDRGHATARAYIERARGALLERQREGDELFHSGAAALKRGDRATARRLLTSAVERSGSGEEALALLHRLDRLETTVRPDARERSTATRVDRDAAHPAPRRRDPRLFWIFGGIVAGTLIASVAGGYLWIVSEPIDLGGARAPLVSVQDPLQVPAPCELRLMRARVLVANGQLHEALTELEAGDPDARHRADFDALRATIQRQLLQNGRAARPPQPTPRPQ